MNKILSIIVPSYNMEAYLDKCISSVICDRIDDIEIIIVNDGSKDQTLHIASKYVDQYPKSIKLIDKPNGNYGSCINEGLKIVTGNYIKILDADDSFETENLNEFIEYLYHRDEDLIISNYSIVNTSGTVTNNIKFNLKELSYVTFKDAESKLENVGFEMHSITYARKIFNRFNYHQTEGISYTDQEWMFTPMYYVKSVSYFPQTVYKYLIGREGQTVDPSVSYRMVAQTIKVMSGLINVYSSFPLDIDDSHKKYFFHRLYKKIPSIYRIILLRSVGMESLPELIEFDELLKNKCNVIYDSLSSETVKFIPFHFIRHWREKECSQSILLRFSQIIILLATKFIII